MRRGRSRWSGWSRNLSISQLFSRLFLTLPLFGVVSFYWEQRSFPSLWLWSFFVMTISGASSPSALTTIAENLDIKQVHIENTECKDTLPLGGKVLFYGLTCWKSAPKSGSIPASPARLVSLSTGGNSSEGGATKDQRGSLGEENLLWGAIVQISSSLSLPVALPAEASPTSWKSFGSFSSSLGLYTISLATRRRKASDSMSKEAIGLQRLICTTALLYNVNAEEKKLRD